jgi:hypothetical protein
MTGKDLGKSEQGGIARVTFRVRCEKLGYGESVFLYPDDESSRVSSSRFGIELNYIALGLIQIGEKCMCQ